MHWINTTHLHQYGLSHDSKGSFPLIISKLIRATTTNLKKVDFPNDRNVYMGGWDGILITEEGNEFSPEGISLWEFGTTPKVKKKANEDYEKRTLDSLGYPQSKSTFVFVTPFVWGGKGDWIEEREKDNIWKKIIVYDAQDLESWFSIAPAVGKWFAERQGILPTENLLSGEEFWDAWSIGPDFKLHPELIIQGREKEKQIVIDFVLGEPNVTSIRASSREEAIAFVLASLFQLNERSKQSILSRLLIVEDETSFRKVVSCQNSLILIPKFGGSSLVHTAKSKGHSIIVPSGPEPGRGDNAEIELPKLNRDGFVAEIQKLGLEESIAKKISKETGRNLTILRRHFNFDYNNIPNWATGEKAVEIIGPLLMGRWDESFPEDLKILESMSEKSYTEISKILLPLLNRADTPFRKIGSKWRLISPLDSWNFLAAFITDENLRKFEEIYSIVLGTEHPKFELNPGERMYAQIQGKKPSYSGWLKQGLCQTLMVLAIHGDQLRSHTSITNFQLWVDKIIIRLLSNASGSLWCSISPELPQIAEASPDSFLQAIEKSCESDEKLILKLFEEEQGIISPHSYHSGLLWGLETIAWLPEYLSKATLVLGRLNSLDPGGTLSNRPINSLRQIYLPWLPQTYADWEARNLALNTLASNDLPTSEQLFPMLLPKGYDVGWPGHALRWRQFEMAPVKGVKYPEIFAIHEWLIDKILELAPASPPMVQTIVDAVDFDLLPKERKKILDYLRINRKSLDESSLQIWHKLRKTLSGHRSIPDAKWAYPESVLQEIDEIFDLYKPSDIFSQNIWVFENNWPEFPEGLNRKDISSEETILNERKIKAFEKLYNSYSLIELSQFAESLGHSFGYGDSAAHIITDPNEEIEFLIHLIQGNEKQFFAAKGFIRRKYFLLDEAWLKATVDNLLEQNILEDLIGELLSLFSDLPQIWGLVESLSQKIKNVYWTKMTPYLYNLELEQKIFVVESLKQQNRYFSIIDRIAPHSSDFSSKLILDVLIKALTVDRDEPYGNIGHDIVKLLKELDERTDISIQDKAQLEWMYLPLLTQQGRSGRKPKYLHKELSESPEFFVEVLKWVYRHEDENKSEEEKKEKTHDELFHRSQQGMNLLKSWKDLPGVNENGIINKKLLIDWVLAVRRLATEAGRIIPADGQIGKILGKYPDNNDQWPPEEIADIIDQINSETINSNFCIQIFNNRGTVSKAVFEGGDQERTLADHLKKCANHHQLHHPITASILRKLAEQYEAEGVREDRRAEQEESEY